MRHLLYPSGANQDKKYHPGLGLHPSHGAPDAMEKAP